MQVHNIVKIYFISVLLIESEVEQCYWSAFFLSQLIRQKKQDNWPIWLECWEATLTYEAKVTVYLDELAHICDHISEDVFIFAHIKPPELGDPCKQLKRKEIIQLQIKWFTNH